MAGVELRITAIEPNRLELAFFDGCWP